MDCPIVVSLPRYCRLNIDSNQVENLITVDYTINDGGLQTTHYNSTSNVNFDFYVGPVNVTWVINISLNNKFFGGINISYEDFSERPASIQWPTAETTADNFMLFTVILMQIQQFQVIQGSGIYVYGIMLSLLSPFVGLFLLAAAGIGVIITAEIAGRLLS